MKLQDKDIYAYTLFSNGVIFKVNQKSIIDAQDDEGKAVLWLYSEELREILKAIASTKSETSRVENTYQGHVFNSAKMPNNQWQLTLLLTASKIKDASIFVSKDSLSKMMNTVKRHSDQIRKSEEFDAMYQNYITAQSVQADSKEL